MAAKYQLITELYRRTGMAVAKNPQAWQGFLSSACRNYKCRFDEQLLIYAQRPDATAVAEIGTWNRFFKRWVNKDSKGIAVFDPKGRRNTLKYYFDVSDTHEGYYGSRAVPIWQMDKRYEQPVMERLADRFGGTEGGDFATFLIGTAENAVEDNLPDYLSQLKGCTKDSFLEELDDYNIEVIYKQLAANSVAYMLLNRCGLDADGYFEREDFAEITNFNTPQTLNAIGIATSDISEMALREISAAVRNVQIEAKRQNRTFVRNVTSQYDKGRKQPERSENNERNHLHETGGLSYSRPDITDRARASAWQVRFDAQGLSGKPQEGNVPQPADRGQAERTPLPDRADGVAAAGVSDEATRQRAGSDGGAERESPDAVARHDEQHPQPSGGSDTGRTNFQLETTEPEEQTEKEKGSVANGEEVAANLPTVDEQIEMIAEAEDEKASAFAVSQEDIDAVLIKGNSVANGKYRIYHQFQKQEDKKKNIDFLKREYGTGGFFVNFLDGTEGYVWYSGKGISIDRDGISTEHDLVLSWSKAEKRLRELVKDNRYLKTERQFFVTGVNCDPTTARDEMMMAKAQWNDQSEIVCYHGFQSFKAGEVTPEQAHEVGVKLAEKMWGGRFQVIVATHLNTECLHNHFVVNSISYIDGRHYHDNKKNLRLLPVHCQFIMDEFANVSLPDDFDKILSVMRSRGVSVSIILQNLAQLKALFEKQWESIVGNADEFLYLGGNEQSTHKFVSELLGKATIDTNTYGKSSGRSGNYSTNYQISGRELLTPDEVRMLDNRYALLFVRGERPVMDLKYDILKHPNVKLTADGGKPPYIHGEPTQAVATFVFGGDIPKDAVALNPVSTSYELLSDEDLEEIFNL